MQNWRLRLQRLVIGLKKSRQSFNQWEAKPKPIAPYTRDFSRASSELQVIARNCDWFIALFVSVVIGRSNCFGFGFSTVLWKPKTALLHNDWNTTACHDTTSFLGSLFFPCPDPGNEVGHDKPLKLFKLSFDHSVHVNVFQVSRSFLIFSNQIQNKLKLKLSSFLQTVEILYFNNNNNNHWRRAIAGFFVTWWIFR